MQQRQERAEAPLLTVDSVSVRFGGIVALDRVSFDVRRGEVRGLIGPNGAGKSTLFNCLSRLYRCDSGTIHFDGHALSRMPRHRIAKLGVGRTFQNLALFRTMTVRDNVLVGVHSHHHNGFLADALRLPGAVCTERAAQARVDEALELVGLQAFSHRIVADLPFGTQKRVELARALASEPSLLLLDEPACGLNHEELSGLGELILDIRKRLNLTVLLVEHHMGLIMGVCDRIVALNFGRKIADGSPEHVRNHPDVIRAYLGAEEGETA
ncbi:ABC transporter ATP-binding protein [Burkholderia sp. Bp9142]|uniref:ABC transporter ATP-binding protein n=1 Tax=Burkholderia sp. Bp9142 TaxID=2184573 RepID=UPI000F5A3293|nr:ABC transporter ATP-binding protein [Burkholderia sp. Bp9142]RQR25777.1 ABC transporter ATP-binding protein [Burkholderia sp. Bp9142]